MLVLQLKRFSYGKHNKQKINTRVIVEKELDLRKYISHSNPSSQDKNTYDLVGVVHHSGDIDFGHYTAECMNPLNRKWYSYNDSNVTETNMDGSFQSNTPYLLFYARKD